MPSMVFVGNLGSRCGPPGAFGGPQTGSNTSVSRQREPTTVRFTEMNRRVGVAPGGYALLMGRLPTTPGM